MGKGDTKNITITAEESSNMQAHTAPREIIQQPEQIAAAAGLCLRCQLKEVAIINLPCGHAVCCDSCASQETLCSRCGVPTRADAPIN